MSANLEVFRKLLTVNELFHLYCQIGVSVFTYIDIVNMDIDKESTDNSLALLLKTLLIRYDEVSKTYNKKSHHTDVISFSEQLYKMMLDVYPDAFKLLHTVKVRYDEGEAKYYTKRNYIQLELSGLLMLLECMGMVRVIKNNVFFYDTELLGKNAVENQKRKTNIEEFAEQMLRQEKFGNDAELAAMVFEKKELKLNSILLNPERVSLYDVYAGYDIASYQRSDSTVHDKFIEVKSCADETLRFFISKNEVETAKRKGDSYFLYLLNRKTNEFTIIKNPYSNIFAKDKSQNWAIEPQLFQIHAI